MAVKRSTRMFKSHPDSSRVRQDQPDLSVDDYSFCVLFGSTFQTFAAMPYYFDQTGIGEIFVFAKPFFDPRRLALSVSGLHLLCPYLEVNPVGHP